MTEHYNKSPEQFVDKTIVRSGIKEINGTNCQWILHALPEYVDGDEKLSMGVVDKVSGVLMNLDCKDATVTVVEGYEDEKFGKEHYRLSMVFGDGHKDVGFIYAKGYSAEGDHGMVKGEVRTTIGLSTNIGEDLVELSEEATSIYIKEMESIYTDWKNEWEGGMFVAIPY